MTLGKLQRHFTLAFARLIIHAYDAGYEATMGDTYRDPRVFGKFGSKAKGAYGRKNSLHKYRLAADLNLFKDGEYLQQSSDHLPLGEWWEAEYAVFNASSGTRFNDGNHYSFAYQGFR